MTVPVDGLLLDFKSTRYSGTLRQAETWQLIGYLLLDTADQYRIDTVGLYLSRSGALASWPVEEYLELLGACRRDIAVFRSAFTELLEGCTADAERYEQEEEDRVQRLLRRLAPVADPGHCLVCTLPRLEPMRLREFSPPRAAAAPRLCATRDCCPAVQPCCSPALESSTWTSPTTRRL